MAGGVIVNAEGRKEYPGNMTLFVFLACLVASSGGLIFGYDIGISGDLSHPKLLLTLFELSILS